MARQERLKYIYRFLASHRPKEIRPIWIPQIWNECGYTDILDTKHREIKVDPVPFLLHHLNFLFQLSESYAFEEQSLDRSIIYSSLVRYTAAWDYNHDGRIQSGTFLRLMILLPLLKKMGVNILYLLPVTRYSQMHWKGDIGSPYAVHSLFELDPDLHDPLLDGISEFTLHDEMAALVEACHLLGVKVVVDFIPRVTARDGEVIEDHPDWVYWIDKEHLEGFRPPYIPELGFFEECSPDKLETIYRSKETAAFLSKFSPPPNELNPLLWQCLKQRARRAAVVARRGKHGYYDGAGSLRLGQRCPTDLDGYYVLQDVQRSCAASPGPRPSESTAVCVVRHDQMQYVSRNGTEPGIVGHAGGGR